MSRSHFGTTMSKALVLSRDSCTLNLFGSILSPVSGSHLYATHFAFVIGVVTGQVGNSLHSSVKA